MTDKNMKLAVPIATDFATKIVNISNNQKGFEPGPLAGLISSLVFQNIVTSIAMKMYKAGSKEGELFIQQMYGSAVMDAITRWNRQDLKDLESLDKVDTNKEKMN